MQHVEQSASSSGASSRAWFAGYAPSNDGEGTTFAQERAGVDTTACNEYRDQLSTRELISEVRRLLLTQRRAERLICRYLADLADRIGARGDRELAAYIDEFHAARCFFGLGVRETRERVRIGRALRHLPLIERAFVDGALSYSRVREVTRVAAPETERDWLSLAARLDMRALERRVAMARERESEGVDAAGPSGKARAGSKPEAPARAEWTSPTTLRVTLELGVEAWALVERAMAGARRLSADTLNDGEALEAVARDALTVQNDAVDASDPRCSVVLYECKACGASELDTGAGAVELDAASAGALGCGAVAIDLATEGRGSTRGGALPAAMRRAVMLRDRCACRVPGCNRRRYVDVHHMVPQANGGEHSRNNCVVLCTTHHRLLHEGKLEVSGDAEGVLDFRDARGDAIVESQVAVRDASGVMPPGAATQGGSREALGSDDVCDHPAARRLLAIMGRRGGWTMDALGAASGLAASEVSVGLLMLELGRRVQKRDFAFDPV